MPTSNTNNQKAQRTRSGYDDEEEEEDTFSSSPGLDAMMAGVRRNLEIVRAGGETGGPYIADVAEWGTVDSAVIAATKGRGRPGLGAHGTLVQGEEMVDIDELVPNPFHVRIWDPDSEEVRLRAQSIAEGPYGQIEPIIATPLAPDHPLAKQGSLLVIDGHGNLAAGKLARMSKMRVKVEMSGASHLPLSPYEAIEYWLTRTVCRRPPTKMEIALAFLRMRALWDQALDQHGEDKPFQSDAQIARNLGVGKMTIVYAHRLADQPQEIIKAMRNGLLLESHVLRLHKELPDTQQRLMVARRLIEENQQRVATSRPLLSAGAVVRTRDELFPTLHLTAPAVDPLGAPPDHIGVGEEGMVEFDDLNLAQLYGITDEGAGIPAARVVAAALLDSAAILNALNTRRLLPDLPAVRDLLRTLNTPELLRQLRSIIS